MDSPSFIECRLCGREALMADAMPGRYMRPPFEGYACPDCVAKQERREKRERDHFLVRWFSRRRRGASSDVSRSR